MQVIPSICAQSYCEYYIAMLKVKGTIQQSRVSEGNEIIANIM